MLKSLRVVFLVSVIGSAALAGAVAADMPVAEPVENVKVCELYGAGFWYIPGTETCMQLGGYARMQVHLNSSNLGYDPWEGDPFQIRDESLDLRNDTFSMVARGLVNFDVRTETPYGALRSFIQIRGTAYDEDNASVELDLAFLQFAGFTAGLAPSFFNIEVPTEYLGHHIGDFSEDQIVFAYSAELGHGIQATLAVESGERANQDGFVLIDPDLLVVAPDADWAEAAEARNDLPALVAKLRVEQAWGTAGLAGAIGENRTRRLDIDFETGDPVAEHEESDLGWAIAGGLTIKVPVFGESDSVSVKASYSEGLSFYTLGSIPSVTWVGDDEISSAKVFSVFGGLTHYWTPTIRSNLAASLFDADFDFGDDSRVSGITTSANVIWSPVPNLDIGVELIYSNIDADADAARVLGVTLDDDRADSINDDGFGAIFRIQRNFGS